MAYERTSDTKIKGDGLDAFVKNLGDTYTRQLSIRNAKDELRFQTAVLEDNLSLNEQLEWRNEQLKRVKDDPEETRRVRAEIAGIKDRVEQRAFTDSYIDKLTDFQSGLTSIDSVIEWLETSEASATDDTIKQTIKSELAKKRGERFEISKNLIKNQTEYALNTKTESVLQDQIKKVESQRSKALLSGNDELVSIFDLHLQALTKANTEASIERNVLDFATTTMSGHSKATDLLDAYNEKITQGAGGGPVTIGGTTYQSAKEFWEFKRGEYISDTGAGGFFSRYNGEQNTKVSVANSQNKLDRNGVLSVSREYDKLSRRPELQGFETQIEAFKQDSIQTGADFLANSVIRKFNNDLDADAAITKLEDIRTLGVNIETSISSIIQSAAATKQSQVSNILGAAQKGIASGLSIDEAIKQAVASGAGATVSPNQLVNRPESEIASELLKGGQSGAFGDDPRTTGAAPGANPSITRPTSGDQPTATPPPQTFNITSQLDFGGRSSQVKELQKFLNASGFQLGSSGAGAPGAETDFFGPLTQAAVKKFQAAQGIVSSGDPDSTGFGRVGPKTLAAIKAFNSK